MTALQRSASALLGLFATVAVQGGSPRAAEADQLTPIVAVAHTPSVTPVLGLDDKIHLVYELRLMNARQDGAVVSVAVEDAVTGRVLQTIDDADALAKAMRRLDASVPPSPAIEAGGVRLLLMHVSVERTTLLPKHLVHRLKTRLANGDGKSASGGDPTPITFSAGAIAVSQRPVPVLGPPLHGNHWVAINGCCDAQGVHRGTGLPVNGEIRFAQRFAIDWMRLNDQGYLVQGDDKIASNYTAYGADVLAVADGAVVDTLDTLDDQVPPSLPLPGTVTVRTADGNHVILDIGNGYRVLYAHLQKGAIGVKVHPGDHVKRGQVIGKLGNSGNTSAPHLHLHVMDGLSATGSNGLPYVINGFSYSGQVTPQLAASSGIGTHYGAALFDKKRPVARRYPLDFAIVDFK